MPRRTRPAPTAADPREDRPSHPGFPGLQLSVLRYTLFETIHSCKGADAEALFAGKRVPQLVNIRTVAERKLQVLNPATKLDDLRIPPNNRLEALKGNRVGTYSIRINDQWRICFRFEGGNAFDVEIVDDH